MRLKGIFLFFACLLFLSMSNCQAEERKEEWKNPDFNFSNVKTIVVNTSVDPAAELDKFNIRKMDTYCLNAFSQDGKEWSQRDVKFISRNQLIDRISEVTGEDMRQLEVEDQVHYKSQMDSFTPLIADAILEIKVTSFGYDERFVPKSSYTYTEKVETEIEVSHRDSRGRWIKEKKKIKQPVKRRRIIPAHYDTYGNVGMDYTLIDTKTNEAIWMLLDVREALGKDPIDMAERIINRTADRLSKL